MDDKEKKIVAEELDAVSKGKKSASDANTDTAYNTTDGKPPRYVAGNLTPVNQK